MSSWLCWVKNILDSCGLSNIFLSHYFPNIKWLTLNVERILTDQVLQTWHTDVSNFPRRRTIDYLKINDA